MRGCSTEWIFQHAQARSSALQRAPARSSALPRAPAHSSELQRTCSSLSLPCPCAARSQARAFASGCAGALPSVAAISSVQAPCVDNRARRAISLANRGVVQRSLLRGSCSQQWVEAYTQMSRAVAAVGSAWFAPWEGCRATRIPIVDGASRRVVSRARDFLKSRFFIHANRLLLGGPEVVVVVEAFGRERGRAGRVACECAADLSCSFKA